GLAGAVVPDQRRHLPSGEVQVHVRQSLDWPEALVEPSHLQERLARVLEGGFHVSLGHLVSLFLAVPYNALWCRHWTAAGMRRRSNTSYSRRVLPRYAGCGTSAIADRRA